MELSIGSDKISDDNFSQIFEKTFGRYLANLRNLEEKISVSRHLGHFLVLVLCLSSNSVTTTMYNVYSVKTKVELQTHTVDIATTGTLFIF